MASGHKQHNPSTAVSNHARCPSTQVQRLSQARGNPAFRGDSCPGSVAFLLFPIQALDIAVGANRRVVLAVIQMQIAPLAHMSRYLL